MENSQRLIDLYLPPADGFRLESLVATTYQVDFAFLEEELLAAALGVRSPLSRTKAFRSELERQLQTSEVSVLYDLRGCERLARLSPRIDAIPIGGRKLHSKVSLLMWVRSERDNQQAPDRLMRLIVGSANLTRQGFRENYECIGAMDFGGGRSSPRPLLADAISLVRQIAAESESPQLQRQLDSFESQAAGMNEGELGDDNPTNIVVADQVLSTIQSRWAETTSDPPAQLVIVSPFWPEGTTASTALVDLINRFQSPVRVELVCRSALSADGHGWIPEFESDVATSIRQQIPGRLFLRSALPHLGVADVEEEDEGDETEESGLAAGVTAKKSNADKTQRALHAKMIRLDGPGGSVLYVGSSNCTRRGLSLGGPTNWETGFVYQLSPQQRKQLQPLFAFFGPATEVLPDVTPETQPPSRDEEPAVPAFLSEVTASGTQVTVSLRDGVPIPNDLVILMEIPSRMGDRAYWLLHRQVGSEREIVTRLEDCPRCDTNLVILPTDDVDEPILPHVIVEVRWQGHTATFPVRFDDKATLPLLLVGRKATEGELIEYFLFGREPNDDNGDGGPEHNQSSSSNDNPIDTHRILAYFMRRFVQAIPGIEAEVQRAAYSRAALDSVLRGPTSPLELAERAFASLSQPPPPDEPQKTETAVAFQLTEILAALLRCQAQVEDKSLTECFDPVIARCRELLERVAESNPHLGESAFRIYHHRFVGATE